VARRFDSGFVIGADTVVLAGNLVLGKPRDNDEARRMLALLSGRWHSVLTGVVVRDIAAGSTASGVEVTRVSFAGLDDQLIQWYIDTGEPFDKAGAYAIQGRGAVFVEQIAGNYSNVVGLPVPLVRRLANELGVSLLESGD
jgi:septum formation protein